VAAAWIDGQPGIVTVRDAGDDVVIDVIDTDTDAVHALATFADIEPAGTSCVFADRRADDR
jgi:hypothetical protein